MDKQLKEIIDKIVAYIDPVKIFLFGSRTRGDSRNDSDYDIVVIYDGEMSKREVKLGIYDQFEDFNFSMDLFVLASQELEKYKRIANTLAREITENGTLVYG
ncbi:nucleotidyltransferase domain-containing protein [bacterium]|nr:nucleotidyltransferase domain-containing protein [bacterium]